MKIKQVDFITKKRINGEYKKGVLYLQYNNNSRIYYELYYNNALVYGWTKCDNKKANEKADKMIKKFIKTKK